MTDAEQATADATADAKPKKVMAIPVVKAKDGKETMTIEVDLDQLPTDVYKYALFLGLKAIINRGTTKVTKAAYPKAGELAKAAMETAKKQVEAAYEGKTRMVGGTRTKGTSDAKVMTEARRIARQMVKDDLKAAGEKVSHYEAREITKAANAYIEADPSILEQAKASLEAAAKAKKPTVDLKKIVKSSPKLIAAAEAKTKKTKPKAEGQASAAKAGQVAARPAPKPAARPHA